MTRYLVTVGDYNYVIERFWGLPNQLKFAATVIWEEQKDGTYVTIKDRFQNCGKVKSEKEALLWYLSAVSLTDSQSWYVRSLLKSAPTGSSGPR